MHALPFAAFLFVAPATLPVTAPVVAPSEATIILPVVDPSAQTPVAPMAAPVEYSDEYKLRAKIHKIGSFAMLPLAVTEYALGTSVYNGNTGNKGLHIATGVGISSLFAVNTVTGLWNLWEGRNDENGRTKRFAHALLMLASDAGFVATFATAPEGRSNTTDQRNTHRTMALTSLALGTAGYLLMLIGK